MKRQDLLHSSYIIARELLTKLLFECHETIEDQTDYEFRTVGELTYCISYGGGQEVECSIERVYPSGRIMYYDFVSDEVAKMLRRDMDAIQSQVDELLAAEENEAEHEEFVLANWGKY